MSVNLMPSQGRRWLTALCALLVAAAPAFADDPSWPERARFDAPAFETLNQWSIVPLSGARLEGQARFDSRQEFKLSTATTGRYGLYGANEFGPAAPRLDNIGGLDQPRATYRYTWLSMREVDLKVGLTSNLSPFGLSSLRSGFAAPMRFGSLPQMHLSGVGRLTNNWRIALDADGLWTARGRSLDVGLNIDYSLSPSMQVFGGYRLTDFGGDAEDFYGSGTINSANVGLRYRF
jgi:opacity protein-like surface antigen